MATSSLSSRPPRHEARSALTTPDEAWLQYFGEAFSSYKLDMRIPPLAKAEPLAAFTRPTPVFGASDDISFPGAALVARAKVVFPQAEVELLEGCRLTPPTDDGFRNRLADRITRFLGPS